jgi:hypothetical protein
MPAGTCALEYRYAQKGLVAKYRSLRRGSDGLAGDRPI